MVDDKTRSDGYSIIDGKTESDGYSMIDGKTESEGNENGAALQKQFAQPLPMIIADPIARIFCQCDQLLS
jgi:hypothetical protein